MDFFHVVVVGDITWLGNKFHRVGFISPTRRIQSSKSGQEGTLVIRLSSSGWLDHFPVGIWCKITAGWIFHAQWCGQVCHKTIGFYPWTMRQFDDTLWLFAGGTLSVGVPKQICEKPHGAAAVSTCWQAWRGSFHSSSIYVSIDLHNHTWSTCVELLGRQCYRKCVIQK